MAHRPLARWQPCQFNAQINGTKYQGRNAFLAADKPALKDFLSDYPVIFFPTKAATGLKIGDGVISTLPEKQLKFISLYKDNHSNQ